MSTIADALVSKLVHPTAGFDGTTERNNNRTAIASVRPKRAATPHDSQPTCHACNVRGSGPRISVVLPTLNEQHNIDWVLRRLPVGLHEVILVDGWSADDTIATAKQVRPDIRVVLQRARGKGAALALGLTLVTGDIAVMIDADGSMDPAEIPGLVGALLSGADVVKGSRSVAGGGSSDLTAIRKLGNWLLTFLANRLYHCNWRELCYGYAAFWTDVLPLLGLSEITGDAPFASPRTMSTKGVGYGHGFEIEAILFCRSARANLRVAEVFSVEHERRFGVSNLATWRDGWRVLGALLRERHYRLAGVHVDRQLRTYPVVPHVHAALSATRQACSC